MTGIVTAVRSGSMYVDKKRRVTVRIPDCDSIDNSLTFPNDTLELDQEVRLTLEVAGDEASNSFETYQHIKDQEK